MKANKKELLLTSAVCLQMCIRDSMKTTMIQLTAEDW